MENKSNKDAIIIILLVVLLLAVIGGFVWYYISQNNTNKVEVTQNNNEQTLIAKDAEISSLKGEVEAKDKEISSLKKENEELKKNDESTKNEFVLFDGEKVKQNGKYVTNKVTIYPVTIEISEDDIYMMEINEKGEINVHYKNKTYTVKGFTKKVVELYAMDDQQTAIKGGIAIMEDGTIEQIYFDGNNFKTRGTIGGVKDVVKLIYVKVNGHRNLAAVQADGNTIVLAGLKNYYNPGA